MMSRWLRGPAAPSSSVSTTQVGPSGVDTQISSLSIPAEPLADSATSFALGGVLGSGSCSGFAGLIRKPTRSPHVGIHACRPGLAALPSRVWPMATAPSDPYDLFGASPLGLLLGRWGPANSSRPTVGTATRTLLPKPGVFGLSTGYMFPPQFLASLWLLSLIGVGARQLWAGPSPSQPADLPPLDAERG